MACEETTPCPCVPYESTGCLDIIDTDCIKYSGDPITCLEIATGDTLTEILAHLEDVICAMSPTTWESYDYGCLLSVGSTAIETQEEFVESVAAILCEIMGTQEPGGLTSLSSIATSLTTHTSQIAALGTHTTLDCFETISGLPGPTASLSALLSALQQAICDHEDSIDDLTSLGSVSLTANDSATIDFTTSGTGNHTLTGSVKLSATANNAVTAEADGIHVLSPVITVVDTASIDLTVSGVHSHTLTADVKISSEVDNILVENVDGLFVPATSSTETSITANDSTTVNFTTSGTSNHTITAAVTIDPDPSNIISATANGIFANGSSFSLADNSVTNAKLRDSVAYSVIGRTSGTTGDPADIAASANQVLRRSGSGNLEFGTLVTANIGDNQVTLAKLATVGNSKILARSDAGTGNVQEVGLGTNLSMDATADVLNAGGTLIGITRFVENGTWTKPDGCNKVIVVTVGAGGGGGGANSSAAEAAFGNGGGAGGFVMDYITTGLGATETVTVGTGGDGGAVGNSYAGQNGGNSSFGAHTSATGGTGGTTVASGSTVALGAISGTGGSYTANATTIVGSSGGTGGFGIRLSGTVAQGGLGGSSYFGGWASGGELSYGSGGAGTYETNGDTNDGVNGGTGIVIVYEYT
jgi:hypothetical protein